MGDDLLTSISMLNSSIQNASNAYLTSKASKDDRKFAEAMYQRQVEDARANWMMQNEYNSPAAQSERLIAAGINPATAWSKGMSSDTGNSSEPEMATPLSWNKRIPAGLSQINPFEQLAAVLNAEKVKAEVKKLGADTKNIDKATEQTELAISRANFEFELDKIYSSAERSRGLEKQLAEIEEIWSKAKTTDELGELYYIQRLIESKNFDILIQKEPYLIEELKKTIKLTEEKIKTEKTAQGRNVAERDLANSQRDYTVITSKDKLADYIRKIDDAFELYLDEHGDIQVDKEKLAELKEMAYKEAKNAIRQQNQNYWNPFRYIGGLLSGAGAEVVKKKLP